MPPGGTYIFIAHGVRHNVWWHQWPGKGRNKQFLGLKCVLLWLAVNGGWSSWSIWSPSCPFCGMGVTSRHRVCNNPLPFYGGANCSGESDQELSCTSSPCPGMPTLFIVTGTSSASCLKIAGDLKIDRAGSSRRSIGDRSVLLLNSATNSSGKGRIAAGVSLKLPVDIETCCRRGLVYYLGIAMRVESIYVER